MLRYNFLLAVCRIALCLARCCLCDHSAGYLAGHGQGVCSQAGTKGSGTFSLPAKFVSSHIKSYQWDNHTVRASVFTVLHLRRTLL